MNSFSVILFISFLIRLNKKDKGKKFHSLSNNSHETIVTYPSLLYKNQNQHSKEKFIISFNI